MRAGVPRPALRPSRLLSMDEDPLPTSFPAAAAWQVDGGSRPSRSSSPRPWAVGYNRICDQLNALVLCFLLILVLCIMALRFRPPPACVLPARAPGDGRGGGGVFLLVGLLSTGGNVAQRQAVRDTFALAAQASGLVDYRFVLEPGERTEAVAQEAKRWKDIIFAAETRSNYLLTKAFRVFEYAAERGAAFVLKTDDEAFVNVPPLVAQLRAVCQDASGRACWGQGVYLGAKATTAGAGRFRNDDFPFNTGLTDYMAGGGYVLSGGLAAALVAANASHPLRLSAVEDATLGFWLLSFNARPISSDRFLLDFSEDWEGKEKAAKLDQLAADMCNEKSSWLLIHKVGPEQLLRLGTAARACKWGEPWRSG